MESGGARPNESLLLGPLYHLAQGRKWNVKALFIDHFSHWAHFAPWVTAGCVVVLLSLTIWISFGFWAYLPRFLPCPFLQSDVQEAAPSPLSHFACPTSTKGANSVTLDILASCDIIRTCPRAQRTALQSKQGTAEPGNPKHWCFLYELFIYLFIWHLNGDKYTA